MNANMQTIINIVGTALLLGLVLRYSGEVVQLVNAGGTQFSNVYQTVSLQRVPSGGSG